MCLPVWKQYLNFLHGPDLGTGHATGILRWPPNLGYSFRNEEAVLQTILDRVPLTASLALGGCVLWLLLGFSTGILAALRPRSLADRAATGLAVLGVSLPVFVTGLGLLYIFYFKLGGRRLRATCRSPRTQWRGRRAWSSPGSPCRSSTSPSTPACCAAACSRSPARTTCAPPAPRACPNGAWCSPTWSAPRSRRP